MAGSTLTDRLPLGIGAAAGVGAWLLTYLFTYLLTASEFQNSIIGQLSDIPTWKSVGWVFFNAHFVSTVVDVPIVGGTTNFIGSESAFTPLLYVLPVLLLLIAGVAVGRAADVAEMDGANAALSGATVVLGYGVLSILGVFLFATDNVSPDLVPGILLAGVLYPIVLGAGGAVAARAL